MNELEELRTRALDMDDDLFLGRLVWYTVSDVRVPHNVAIGALLTSGLKAALPSCPRDVDVFRRVSTNAGKSKVPTDVAGVFENYMVREVAGRGGDEVVRRVVVETVDAAGKKLDYQQIADITYHRADSSIHSALLPAGAAMTDRTVVENIIAEIRNEYQLWQGCLNSYNIREFIRRTILDLGGTNVRPNGVGGLYFVKQECAPALEALEKFVSLIPGEIEVHTLPLIDDMKQRQMVRRAFEAESVDAVDRMLGDIKEVMDRGKKISKDRYASFVTEYQDLLSKTQDYEQVLETALAETHTRLQVFQRAIVNMRHMVKE